MWLLRNLIILGVEVPVTSINWTGSLQVYTRPEWVLGSLVAYTAFPLLGIE